MGQTNTTTISEGKSQLARLDIAIGGFSGPGTKNRNDDAFAAEIPSSHHLRTMKGVVACVADGVSESERSHIASQMAVTQFISDYLSTPDSWSVEESATRVLKALNDWLSSENQRRDRDAMVTTFSAVVVKSQTAHLFHVGDSRIYRIRGTELSCLTRDHSIAFSKNTQVLSAALGMDSRLSVDYHTIDLQQGDVFFLVTDGVFPHFPDTALTQQAQNAALPNTDLDQLSEDVCKLAVQNGSTDNVTCGIIRIDSLPQETVEEAHSRVMDKAIPPVMNVGNRIDDLEVLRIIHSGTRSHIYKVRHVTSGDIFVLKAPSKNFEDDPVYLEGFIQENWIGQRLNSPHLMKVYQTSDGSKFLYLLCELIEGQTLRAFMGDNLDLPLSQARDIIDDIAMGLRALHRMGMVHRDIKPENIMITPDGEVKIIDYGTVQVAGMTEIASAIVEDHAVGSVQYSAPEYVLGSKANSQSDLFSLGVIAYELMTGKRPYRLNESNRQKWTLSDWGHTPAHTVKEDMPRFVSAALERACTANPDFRYPVLSEFLADLRTPGDFARQKQAQTSLLERNPVLFWKSLSFILLAVSLVLAILLNQA